MSANAAHDAIGPGFLSHLVARHQRPATMVQSAVLERRRPGIFEPRSPASATTLDIVETTVAPGAALFSRAAVPAPQAPSHLPRVSAAATPAQTNAAITAASPVVSRAQMPAAPRAAPLAEAAPAPTTPHKPRGTPSVATPSPRDEAVRATPVQGPASRAVTVSAPALAPTSPQPSVTLPQTTAMRGVQTVRVEQSRFESRTTVVARSIEKYRDPPALSTPTPTLKLPPRLASSAAPPTPVAHPARSAALLAAPAPISPAPVQVSIGRVEIRASAATPPPAVPRSAVSKPQLSLDEYLQQRHGNGR